MTYLPDLRRLLLAACTAVALSLLGVTIASASAARTAEPHSLPLSPSVSIDLRLAQRAAITVGPGEHVRLVVEVAAGPRASRAAATARLFVVRMSDGARIFNGRLADARSIELGRVAGSGALQLRRERNPGGPRRIPGRLGHTQHALASESLQARL